MEKNLKYSYTSASKNLPVKVLKDLDLVENITKNGKITPTHIQLNLTNKCNLNCDWCSCSERDRGLSLNFGDVLRLADTYKSLGCKAVTITGGGEPLLYPDIGDTILFLDNLNISIGMVTNGWNVNKLSEEEWNRVTWVRVSLGDGRTKELDDKEYWNKLVTLSKYDIDLSFSYVLTNEPNYSLISKMVKFVNDYNLTHVRIVTDIIGRNNINTMLDVKEFLRSKNIDDNLVIYQDRTAWTRGTKKCYISLLKPVIGADGKIYPCCGSQYLDKEPARNYSGCMGDIEDIDKIIEKQQYFDGSECEVCYYSSYNELLDSLLTDLDHKEFV